MMLLPWKRLILDSLWVLLVHKWPNKQLVSSCSMITLVPSSLLLNMVVTSSIAFVNSLTSNWLWMEWLLWCPSWEQLFSSSLLWLQFKCFGSTWLWILWLLWHWPLILLLMNYWKECHILEMNISSLLRCGEASSLIASITALSWLSSCSTEMISLELNTFQAMSLKFGIKRMASIYLYFSIYSFISKSLTSLTRENSKNNNLMSSLNSSSTIFSLPSSLASSPYNY